MEAARKLCPDPMASSMYLSWLAHVQKKLQVLG